MYTVHTILPNLNTTSLCSIKHWLQIINYTAIYNNGSSYPYASRPVNEYR